MKVLYIIGNGFDQAHEIASSYKDFKLWVKSQHNLRFDAEIAQIEYLFRDNGELWADFETNLGHYKIDIIAEQRFGILPFIIQEYEFDGDIKEQVFGNNMPYIESLTETLQRIFRNWVYSLDTKKLLDILLLRKHSFCHSITQTPWSEFIEYQTKIYCIYMVRF